MAAPSTAALRERAEAMSTIALVLSMGVLVSQPGSDSEAGRTRLRAIAVLRRVINQRWAITGARGRAFLEAREEARRAAR